MDKIDLEELERLAKAATPGPWRVRSGSNYAWIEPIDFPHSPLVARAWTIQGDAAYIVAACNDVPELIARVRELKRQREFLAEALEDVCEWHKKDGVCPVFHLCPAGDMCLSCGEVTKEDWIQAAKEAGNV